MRTSCLCLIPGLLLVLAPAALAVTADIQATASVQTPLSVSGSADLAFGTVFPGVQKSIVYTDATNAGQWDVVGEPDAEVTLSFSSLPASLASGGNTLTIAFGAADAARHSSDAPGSATSFDPATGTTTNLEAGTGALYVWIGGTVQPLEAQPQGLYTATITLDVAYTGN